MPTDLFSDVSGFFWVAMGAFMAGGMNALAGGGTFFSFPALLAAGVPPVTANASNTVALWPASLSGAWAYRHELRRHPATLPALTAVAFVGGILGGLLLLLISNAAFTRLIPWLLLLATALFTFSGPIGRWVKQFGTPSPEHQALSYPALFGQFLVTVYGGFFGAGQGILTLAALSIQGIQEIQTLNALKNWISAVTYTVSALTFIVAGAISWPHTLLMLITASAGGYAGAHLAQRLPAQVLRVLIITVGTTLTLIYFSKTAGA